MIYVGHERNNKIAYLEAIFFISICLCLGLSSGFLGGLLGIGGGIVIVPVLAIYFSESERYTPDVVLLIAVATSLACIVFTSASAALAQARANRVNFTAVKRLLPSLVLGGFIAGYVAPLVAINLLKIFFALFLLTVASVMFFQWRPLPNRQLPGVFAASLIGGVAGFVSALVGIAGGNILVPTLTYFNVATHNATATASVLGLPLAAVGALSYGLSEADIDTSTKMLGWIDLEAAVPIILGAIVAAPLGVRFAQRVPAITLKKIFAGALFLASLRMLASVSA